MPYCGHQNNCRTTNTINEVNAFNMDNCESTNATSMWSSVQVQMPLTCEQVRKQQMPPIWTSVKQA